MKHITKYKLFENNSEMDTLKSETKDYLSSLLDSNFDIDVDPNEENIYSFMISRFLINRTEENLFTWEEIKDDINRFFEISTFKLQLIKIYGSDQYNELPFKLISEIPDNQEILYAEFYLTK